MRHSTEEIEIIKEFLKDKKITLRELALFIEKTFGIKWNITDKITMEYLQGFIDDEVFVF